MSRQATASRGFWLGDRQGVAAGVHAAKTKTSVRDRILRGIRCRTPGIRAHATAGPDSYLALSMSGGPRFFILGWANPQTQLDFAQITSQNMERLTSVEIAFSCDSSGMAGAQVPPNASSTVYRRDRPRADWPLIDAEPRSAGPNSNPTAGSQRVCGLFPNRFGW